jgi:hypothetical protein
LKTGGLISPFLFKFPSENAIMKIQVHEDRLKLKGKHPLWYMLKMLTCYAKAYILCRKTDGLVVASNETGPEENADKTMYVFTSRDQNTG